MNTIALLSMLHEPADRNSATRCFREEAVLCWTLRRIARSSKLNNTVVLAWDDQLDALSELGITARACGARRDSAALEATSAAQRWAEGWRGGLLSTCWFDKGFVPALVLDALADECADGAVWVDPAAGLVDANLLDALTDAGAQGDRDFYFTPAAPGLGGVLVKKAFVEKLLAQNQLPGRVVHYLPDAPVLDPVTSDACVPVPLPVSRSIERFTLDSQRQIDRFEIATAPLNGTLVSTEALGIAERVRDSPSAGRFPRELVIEVTTRRVSRPVFAAVTHLEIERRDMTVSEFETIMQQLRAHDDLRVTLGGAGDPMYHAELEALVAMASRVAAVTIETDLIELSDARLAALVEAGIDIIAVSLPAMRPQTYAAVMGIDSMMSVVENIRRLISFRQTRARGVPLIVPVFHKLSLNLDQMEQWYDTWLRALGSAVIRGPSTFGGKIPDCAAADMTPTVRKSCARIQQRLTILSDGSITLCEEDAAGAAALGNIATHSIADVWAGAMGQVREQHRSLISLPVVCEDCKEWYRP